jgi:hypothetical protein
MSPDLFSILANIATTLSILGVAWFAVWNWGKSWLYRQIDNKVNPKIVRSEEISDRKILSLKLEIEELEVRLETYSIIIDEIVACSSDSINNMAGELYSLRMLVDELLKWCEKDRSIDVSEETYNEWLKTKFSSILKDNDSVDMLLIKIVLGIIHKIDQDQVKLKAWIKNYRSFVEKAPVINIEQYKNNLGVVVDVKHRLSQSSPIFSGHNRGDSKSKKRIINED